MKNFVLPVIVAMTVSACAQTPSSIAPMAVASAEYDNLSCSQLTAEYTSAVAQLSEAEENQRGSVAGDAIGVFLVLIPPSAIAGDYAADVARYKGEKIALERSLDRKSCR